MLRCCTAASAPPSVFPVRIRMSPMWLTSKTPTDLRTALCSASKPPVAGYSTGISHPPKLTMRAPSRRCSAFSGVVRSSVTVGEIPESILGARAEIDTSMRDYRRSKKRNRLPIDADEQIMRQNASLVRCGAQRYLATFLCTVAHSAGSGDCDQLCGPRKSLDCRSDHQERAKA